MVVTPTVYELRLYDPADSTKVARSLRFDELDEIARAMVALGELIPTGKLDSLLDVFGEFSVGVLAVSSGGDERELTPDESERMTAAAVSAGAEHIATLPG